MTDDTAVEPHPFRCVRCGAVQTVVVPQRWYVATLRGGEDHPRKPPAPACARCGRESWVRVGSTTEYYLWTRYADVCQPGEHRDPRTATYRLVPRVPPVGPPPPGHTHVLAVTVRACPDHVDALRTADVMGCVLVDDRPTSDTE